MYLAVLRTGGAGMKAWRQSYLVTGVQVWIGGGVADCTVCVTLELLSVVSITGPAWDGAALVGEGSEVHVSKGGPGTMEGGCSRGVGCGRVVRSADVLWGRASGCRGALRGEPHKGDTLVSWLMGAVLRTCGM